MTARDREVANRFTKDSQITAIRGARALPARDRLSRVVAPHRLTDPEGRPADRGQAAHPDPEVVGRLGNRPRLTGAHAPTAAPLDGLYAAGEVAGFGGGGVHGYRSLEGTFLGGCIFSGRAAGRGAPPRVTARAVSGCGVSGLVDSRSYERRGPRNPYRVLLGSTRKSVLGHLGEPAVVDAARHRDDDRLWIGTARVGATARR